MPPSFSRRRFLGLSALTAPLLAMRSFAEAPKTGPVMLSTWDEGRNVNHAAWPVLSKGGRALDAIETGGIYVENTSGCCVGLDGYPDRDGIVTLDACIMDEKSNCGAVAGLERIKHPISVARRLMETTPHVLIVGNGAQQFALQQGFPLESGTLSAEATEAWQKWLKESKYQPEINFENKPKGGPFAPAFFSDGQPNHDTMGMLALDTAGNLSGGVTTSGMAFKVHGRVGDSAVIGAGLYVDNSAGAATSSGVGEEVIRHCGTHLVVEYMRRGYSPQQACKLVVERIIRRDPVKARSIQVGFIAIDRKGRTGAWAIQDGFTYALKTGDTDTILRSGFSLKASH